MTTFHLQLNEIQVTDAAETILHHMRGDPISDVGLKNAIWVLTLVVYFLKQLGEREFHTSRYLEDIMIRFEEYSEARKRYQKGS